MGPSQDAVGLAQAGLEGTGGWVSGAAESRVEKQNPGQGSPSLHAGGITARNEDRETPGAHSQDEDPQPYLSNVPFPGVGRWIRAHGILAPICHELGDPVHVSHPP